MVAPNLYGSITTDLEEIPKKPRSDKQKEAFEKARAKLAEKRQKAKENNNMSRDITNDEHPNTEPESDLKVVEITPERKVEQVEPPKAPEKKVDDETRPPLWFSTFIKESRENRFLQMKRNREKKKVEREPSPKRVEHPSPETPTPTAPPPSPETPPKIREALKTPTPAARFVPAKNIYQSIFPKRR